MANSSLENKSEKSASDKLLEHVLYPIEAEALVENLRVTTLEEIGTRTWHQQHEHLEKLNVQALVNTKLENDEFVKDFLITNDKIQLLVHELLLIELWKEKVFVCYLDKKIEAKATFPCYTILYHEATVANLLETILFYQETCEVLEETSLDLLEYCSRKLTNLLANMTDYHEEVGTMSLDHEKDIKAMLEKDVISELKGQNKDLNFQIIWHCVTILRNLICNLDCLPLGATRMALNTLDLPLLMVELVEKQPWTNKKKDKLFKYWDGKWHLVPNDERIKLSKTETQLWLIIIQLLLSPNCQTKYEYNDFKKNSILRLRAHIPEYLIDQLPTLMDLQRYLYNLSIMEPPPAKKDIIIEPDHNMRESLIAKYKGLFKKTSESQKENIFFPSDEDLKLQAAKFVETYDRDVVQTLAEGKPKCSECGGEAEHRCSRCKNEWYCSRQCQVENWSKHKEMCSLIASSKNTQQCE